MNVLAQANGQPVGQRGDANGNAFVVFTGQDIANTRLLTETKPTDGDSILETLQAAVVATGVGTAIDAKGYRSVVLDVTGTFVGTVSFQATIDDSNWFALGLANVGTGTLATSATAAGTFSLPTGPTALSQIRANVTAYTSGAITAKSRKHPR